MLTKESGCLPGLCPSLAGVFRGADGVMQRRARCAVLVVKALGVRGQFEVLVGPLVANALVWLTEEMLASLVKDVRTGQWEEVVSACAFFSGAPECERRCGGKCCCAAGLLWEEVGWRRVRVPELHVVKLPGWWTGVSDAVGDCGNAYGAWLRCPCGVLASS
jgi:hypothetical protein